MPVSIDHALLLELRPVLRSIAAGLLGPMTQQEDIDDLAQEGWVALWRDRRKATTITRAWCVHSARWGMTRYLQRQRYGRTLRNVWQVECVGGAEELESIEDVVEVDRALELVEVGYHRGEVVSAVNRLTPAQRRYVLARFWYGLTELEINERLNQAGSGSTWRQRVKPKLREELADLRDLVTT